MSGEFERDALDAAREQARQARTATLRSYLVGLALVALVVGALVVFVWISGGHRAVDPGPVTTAVEGR